MYIYWRIIKIINQTEDTRSYLLQPLEAAVSYQAGQFLTFLLDIGGREIRRAYSICTSPSRDAVIGVLVKRQPNGEASRYIHAQWHEGDIVQSLAPAGKYTLPYSATPRRVFFVAAGSGIAPIWSLLRELLFTEPKAQAVLYYSNHYEADTIFYQALISLQATHPDRLKVRHFWSAPPRGQAQRLNNSLLEEVLHTDLTPVITPSEALFYLCGPSDFMRMVRFTLGYLGIHKAQILTEDFVIAPAPLPPPPADNTPRTLEVRTPRGITSLSILPTQNILQACLNVGIDLPYSCRGGRCSTCEIRLLSGRVRMSINDVLTDAQVAQGHILSCTAYVESTSAVIAI